MSICPLLVSVVRGGVESFDKFRVPILDFFKGFSLLKLEVSQTKLDFQLCLNGLITNDKFCLTRWRQLALRPDRRSYHRRKTE